MKFLVDANMPRLVVELLSADGHDALDVRDVLVMGAADDVVAAHARGQHRVILTRDVEFGDPRVYPPHEYSGIVIFRTGPHARRKDVLEMVKTFVHEYGQTDLAGAVVVVEPDRMRLRRPAQPGNF